MLYGAARISLHSAELTDLGFLTNLTLARSDPRLEAFLEHGEVWIVTVDNRPVGFMSFSILWGILRLLEFIEILAPRRGRKCGVTSVRAWEQKIKSKSFDLVLI